MGWLRPGCFGGRRKGRVKSAALALAVALAVYVALALALAVPLAVAVAVAPGLLRNPSPARIVAALHRCVSDAQSCEPYP